MKKAIPILIALALIVLIGGGALGVELYKKYSPTKERADLSELYEVSGNETAIIFNFELQSSKGIYENGQSYLPLSWINGNINKRFYWDSGENLLVYSLPDRTVYADPTTAGSNGSPLLLVRGDEVYLTVGLVANYTDIQIAAFDSGEAKRVYITEWGTREVSQVKKEGAVRERGGIKSPIVTEVSRGTQVTVLSAMEKWSEVVTPDGHMGYIQNKNLYESVQEKAEGDTKQPAYESISFGEKIVLVWHQVQNSKGNGSLESLIAKTRGVNVVSPTWFSLTDNEGNFRSLADSTYVKKAHEMGLQVWALLDNFSEDVQSEVLLSSTTTRRRLVDSLVAEAESCGADGLNMDFEGLKPEAGVHYVQFLRELSIACHKAGLILSVDNYVPTGYNSFYDRAEQGVVADYVIIMGYDEHYAGGEAGSVASLPYVEGGIERTLESVPKEKVINGVPFYTRLWKEENGKLSSSSMGIAEAKNWVAGNNVKLTWMEDSCQYYGELETSGGKQYLWMEEETSLERKMDLIRVYDLAGVACWKLGLEDDAAWEAIGWD